MKKKPPKKPAESWRHIPVKPFRCGICIFVGTPTACVKHLRKMGFNDSVDVASLKKRSDMAKAVTILLPNGESCIYSGCNIAPGVLIHELCHAVMHMLKDREIDDASNEVMAYTMEYLYEEATK